MTLKEEVSAGLGIFIGENGWDMAFNTLDRRGQVTQRVLIELFLILAKRIENMEEQPLPITIENVTSTIPIGEPTVDGSPEAGEAPVI